MRKQDRKRYKPHFTFDQALERSQKIIDLLSNPLLLRMFLEVYHGKNLPRSLNEPELFTEFFRGIGRETKDGGDLLNDFARICLESQKTEIDLDELYDDERTKHKVSESFVGSAYSILRNKGILFETRSTDGTSLSFVMERFLEHLLGSILIEDGRARNPKALAAALQEFKEFKPIKKACESALYEKVKTDGDGFLFEFIDLDYEQTPKISGTILGQLVLKSADPAMIAGKLMARHSENDRLAAIEAADFLYNEKAYEKAESFLEVITEKDTPLHEDQKREELLSKLAAIKRMRGKYDEAIDLEEKCLELHSGPLQSDPDVIAIKFNNLGLNHYQKGNFGRATELIQQALEMGRQTADNQENFASYNNLGLTLMGKTSSTKPLISTKDPLTYFTNLNIQTWLIQNNIGLILLKEGSYHRAIEYFEAAILGFRESFGENHFEIPTALSNLGFCLYETGEFDNAIEFFKESLSMRIKLQGSDHPEIALVFGNLGLAYQKKGEIEQAIENIEKALSILEIKVGRKHPNYALILNNLGRCIQDQGDLQKAIEFFKEALGIQLEVLGENHDQTSVIYNSLGLAYLEMENFEQAFDYLKKALKTNMEIHGEDHAKNAYFHIHLGDAFLENEEFEQAIEHYEKLSIAEQSEGDMNLELDSIHFSLGTAFLENEELEPAIEHYEKCLSIELQAEENEEEPDSGVAYTYKKLGVAHALSDEKEKAKEHFLKAREIFLATLGPEAPETQDVEEDLVNLNRRSK